jgi:hypothetical protein
MIYAACYHDYHCHHGKLIPISFGIPSFEYKPTLEQPLKFFIPQRSVLRNFRSNKVSIKNYSLMYYEEINANLPDIERWLDSLTPDEDLTLLSWETADQFSHRQLVLELIRKCRPDCYGGANIVNKKAVLT